jgi:hypothetical protein
MVSLTLLEKNNTYRMIRKKKKKNPKKLFVAEARSHIFVVFRA